MAQSYGSVTHLPGVVTGYITKDVEFAHDERVIQRQSCLGRVGEPSGQLCLPVPDVRGADLGDTLVVGEVLDQICSGEVHDLDPPAAARGNWPRPQE